MIINLMIKSKLIRLKRIVAIYLFCLLFCTCTDSNSLKKVNTNKGSINQDLSIDFVKTFEGQLNNKHDIILKITSNSGLITGKYFYKKVGADIPIKGGLNTNGVVILKEFDKSGNQTGVFNGEMVNNNKIVGTWTKPDGSKEMSFVLIESNTAYESSKATIKRNDYEFITGQYDFEYNSEGVSYVSVKINYIGSNKFNFEITTAHQNGCTGEIEGIARINKSGVGIYSGENCKMLKFNFTAKKLIIDENECDLHGVRCWFTGEYIKVN